MRDFTDINPILLLAAALAIGLLVGTERGWRARDVKEGERVAGLRTFGLIGLLGGTVGLLSRLLGELVLGIAFIAIAGAVTTVYLSHRRESGDRGMTSLVAMLLTFALGALVSLGEVNVAASAAVVATLLLRFKLILHGWLRKIEQQELHAALQLLLISVVLLPVLPNQGYGPWQALNPYEIWWMVILIAAISFSGYIAIKVGGAEKGIMFASFFAGLVSSTALTLHFSRLAKRRPGLEKLLASGILVACSTMFPRTLLIAGLINYELFRTLIIPLSVMSIVTILPAIYYWRRGREILPKDPAPLQNPVALKSALMFGGLLALVVLLSKALNEYIGHTGIYAAAAASGIIDVDALNLSLSRMSSTELPLDVATFGIVIAAASNNVVKSMLSMLVGGRKLGMQVIPPLLAATVLGILVAWASS